MAIEAEQLTRCAVCRRSLLTGESARMYRDDRSRGVHAVCALCLDRAERAGWSSVGEDDPRRSFRVAHADPDATADRLVTRLQTDLDRLQDELAGAIGSSAEHAAREQALNAQAAMLRARLTEAQTRIAELERQLAEANEAQEVVLRARRREADASYLAGIAAETFNRSEHASALRLMVAELGEPVVRVAPESIALPRALRITFGWPHGTRAYRVTCDLVTRFFDVEDVQHGSDRLSPRIPDLVANARYSGGRVTIPSLD